ncbi:MAG TPA: HEAT repeat domain-containing protein [Bdellovibrionota bacterium]|nr:HEAT repeat domain-containing protein [Bdellovibrionota bacterium]
MTYLRKRLIFQASLIGFVLATFVPKGFSQQESEEPIRFGDPETFLPIPEESTPTPTPTPAPAKPGPKVTPQPTATPVATPKSSAERVREIIASVPPGDEYPNQFSDLVAIGEEAVPPLAEIYVDASALWQSRWIAGMALGRLGGEEARLALEKGLKDPLFLVRLAAAQALGKMKDPQAAPRLREALSDKAMVVRSAVVDAMAELKDREAVSLLRAELVSPRSFYRGRSLWIREHILEALVSIGGEEAAETLLVVLKEEDPVLLERGCSALAQLVPEAPPAKELNLSPHDCAKQWIAWFESKKTPPAQ